VVTCDYSSYDAWWCPHGAALTHTLLLTTGTGFIIEATIMAAIAHGVQCMGTVQDGYETGYDA